jgi:uncharacterized Tic20 family protein
MDNNNTVNTSVLSSDDKLFALLSHISVVLGGILMPIIIWAIKKDQSKFIRFHSLQAIFYHIAVSVIIIFLVIILVVFVFLGAGIGALSGHNGSSDAMPVMMIIFMVLFYGMIFVIAFGSIGYGIYLAVKSYGGALIKIPFIGNIIYRKVYGAG